MLPFPPNNLRDLLKKLSLHLFGLDIFSLLLLICLNPLVYSFRSKSPSMFLPDTIAYVTMGIKLFHNGLLYLPSWGHFDYGLICPPLYPFFIALGHLFSIDDLNMAEWISSICAILSIIPMYLFLRVVANRVIAVAALFLIQMNYYYFWIGMRPLSEAVFLLSLSWFLFLTLKLFQKPPESGNRLSLLVGMSAALVFLSRQIGLVLILVFGILFLIQSALYKKEILCVTRNAFLFLLGWLIFIVPYSGVVFHQTGQLPFKQHFVACKSNKETTDKSVLEAVERIRNLKISDIKILNGQPNSEYGLIYAKRYLLRELTPDSSKMLSDVVVQGHKQHLLVKAASMLLRPEQFASRFYHNSTSLFSSISPVAMYFFLISCFLPLFIRSKREEFLSRLFLPSFIVIYIISISCFTDNVPRYAYVIFPFAVIHIFSELFILAKHLLEAKGSLFRALVWSVVFIGFLVSTPKFFTDLRLWPKLHVDERDFRVIRDRVGGEAVFTTSPFYSYLTEGDYRILPNDSLKKVAAYAHKTKVRWLLLPIVEIARNEELFYTNAKWCWKKSLAQDHPELVRRCCSTPDGGLVLYEIL